MNLANGRQTQPIVAAVVAAVGAAYLFVDSQYPLVRGGQPGPGLFPLLVGLMLMASAVSYGLEGYAGKQSASVIAADVALPGRAGLARFLAILLAAVGVVLLTPLVGDFVAATAAILVVVRAKGMRDWRWSVATAVLMAATVHYAFAVMLKVPFPVGAWIKGMLP